MRRTWIIIAIVYIFIFLPSLNARPVNYYLDIAFKKNPSLNAQKYETSAAGNDYKSESIFKNNPSFNLAYSNVPVGEWPSLDSHAMSGISIGVSQFIASPWEDYYRKQKSYAKYLSARESLHEARNMLALQVQSAYHSLMFLEKKKLVLEENLLLLKNIENLAASLVSVNKMSSSHLLKLNADTARIQNSIIEIDADIETAISDLSRLCGYDNLEWDVKKEEVAGWIPGTPSSLENESFDYTHHPVYRKLKALYDAQKAALSLEKANLTPGITVGFDYRIRQEIAGKDEGEDFVSVMASIPVPLFYPLKETYRIDAQKQRQKAYRDQLNSVMLQLQNNWNGELSRFKKLRQAFSNHTKKILPGYMAAYRAQVGSLSSGTITLLDVLDSYRMYLDASIAEAKLYRDLVHSRLRIEYLRNNYPLKSTLSERRGEDIHAK